MDSTALSDHPQATCGITAPVPVTTKTKTKTKTVAAPTSHPTISDEVLKDQRIVWVEVTRGTREQWIARIIDTNRLAGEARMIEHFRMDWDRYPDDPGDRAWCLIGGDEFDLIDAIDDYSIVGKQGASAFAGFYVPDATSQQRRDLRERIRLAIPWEGCDGCPSPGVTMYELTDFGANAPATITLSDLSPISLSDFEYPAVSDILHRRYEGPQIPLDTLINRAAWDDDPVWFACMAQDCGYTLGTVTTHLSSRAKPRRWVDDLLPRIEKFWGSEVVPWGAGSMRRFPKLQPAIASIKLTVGSPDQFGRQAIQADRPGVEGWIGVKDLRNDFVRIKVIEAIREHFGLLDGMTETVVDEDANPLALRLRREGLKTNEELQASVAKDTSNDKPPDPDSENSDATSEPASPGNYIPVTRHDLLVTLNAALVGKFGGKVEVARVEKFGRTKDRL